MANSRNLIKKAVPILFFSFSLFGCSSRTTNLEAVTDNVLKIYTSRHNPTQYSSVVVDYIEKTADGDIRSVITKFFDATKEFDLEEVANYIVDSESATQAAYAFNSITSGLDSYLNNYNLSDTEKEQAKKAIELMSELMKLCYQKAIGSYQIEEITVDGTEAEAVVEVEMVDEDSEDLKDLQKELQENPFTSGATGSMSPESILKVLQERIDLLRSTNFPMKKTQYTVDLQLDGADWKIEDTEILEEGNLFI